MYKSTPEFIPQIATKIPWYHNIILLEKLKTYSERLWYAQKTLEHGWSRAVLEHQIDTKLIDRAGKSVNNFTQTLPPIQSDLAKQILKDPYNLDFLTLTADAHERELERGLLENLKHFMLELGAGFAFVGSQYHLEVGEQDFYIDLLFYHLKLRAFVVIDLKTKAFTPEDAGKMQFYLGAVDDLLRHDQDAPSIGLILCKTKNEVIVEYTLKRNTSPIGVTEYQLTQALPDNLKSQLPSVLELETELERLETKLEQRT
jgi:predicted nuclease of restriction endonuclease-like (RecB) superfamily